VIVGCWLRGFSSSSSMSRSRRGPLHRSNSMETQRMARLRVPLVNCSSPVKSGLSIERGVYQGVVSSEDQEDDQPTNRCACRAPGAQKHHSQAEQCVQTDMRRAARISPNKPARRHYWRSQTSELPVSEADISCGKLLTLSCLLPEESNFILHISIQTKPEPHKPAT